MSTEVVKVIDASEIESKNVEVGEWGLEFKGQLTPGEWYETALAIQKFDGKIQWYLGDLAVYAESSVTGWGESKYAELVEGTGYDQKTFSNLARVSRRFPNTQREVFLKTLPDVGNHLSFSHFETVTALDDNFAFYWLQKASDNAWGVAKLREEIRKWKEGRGEIAEKEEKSAGEITFNDQMRKFFKGYLISPQEYDERSWLLEVHDVIEDRLHELGIEL